MTHAQVVIGDWKTEYNHDRPHSSLGYLGPVAYAAVCTHRSDSHTTWTDPRGPASTVRARTRFREHDGQLRRIEASADTRRRAEHRLKEKLATRRGYSAGFGELTPDSSFDQLVEVWLEDLDLEGKLAESTRALYERNMRQLVMPAFENLLLREISVRRVDQFIKRLAAAKSYSTAKQARTVLSLALGLAVRYDALRENPVRETARLHKPPSQTMALTLDQVEAIRRATRSWRRAPGTPGPPPDGQLEQIIEVMLGTSARIGEVLAIRRCDVDVTVSPATVRICGTIVSPAGKPTHRQAIRRLRSRRGWCRFPGSWPRYCGSVWWPSTLRTRSN